MKFGASKSGLIHATTDDGVALCNPKAVLVVTPKDESNCENCGKQIRIMNEQEKLRAESVELPKMIRNEFDGHVYLRRVNHKNLIENRMTPFVTLAAGEQWLAMAKKAGVNLTEVTQIP